MKKYTLMFEDIDGNSKTETIIEKNQKTVHAIMIDRCRKLIVKTNNSTWAVGVTKIEDL